MSETEAASPNHGAGQCALSQHLSQEVERLRDETADQAKELTEIKVQNGIISEKLSDYSDLKTMVQTLEKCVERLNVKSGVWGLLGGLIPAVGILIYFIIKEVK